MTVTWSPPDPAEVLSALLARGHRREAADLAEKMRPDDRLVSILADALRDAGDKHARAGHPEGQPPRFVDGYLMIVARKNYLTAMTAFDLIDGRAVPRADLDALLLWLENKTAEGPDDALREYLLQPARKHLRDLGVDRLQRQGRKTIAAQFIADAAGVSIDDVRRPDKLRKKLRL